MTHVPVGYCGQHRRSCHSTEHDSNSSDIVSHPNTKLSSRGRWNDFNSATPNCGPGLLVCFISLPALGREYPQQGSREEVFRSAEVHLLLQIDPSASDPELVTS